MNGLEAGSVDTLDTDPAIWEKMLRAGNTQLDIALERLRDEACAVDPQSAVARFGSAW
jgi:hypothetical protein